MINYDNVKSMQIKPVKTLLQIVDLSADSKYKAIVRLLKTKSSIRTESLASRINTSYYKLNLLLDSLEFNGVIKVYEESICNDRNAAKRIELIKG